MTNTVHAVQGHETLTTIEELPQFEQLVLKLIAINYESATPTFLAHCLARTDIRAGDGKLPTIATVTSCLENLRDLEIIDHHNRLSPPLAEQITRRCLVDETFQRFAAIIESEAPATYLYGKQSTRCRHAMRQFRIAVYSRNLDKLDETASFLEEQCGETLKDIPPAVLVAAEPFDQEWFATLPGSLQYFLLNRIIRYSLDNLYHYEPLIAYLGDENALTLPDYERVPFHRLLGSHLLFQGRLDELQLLIQNHPDSFRASGLEGSLLFLKGNNPEALKLFARDLELLKEYCHQEPCFFFGPAGLFYIFALILDNAEDTETLSAYLATAIASSAGRAEEKIFRFLSSVLLAKNQGQPDLDFITAQLNADHSFQTTLIGATCLYWLGVRLPDELINKLTVFLTRAKTGSFTWPALVLSELLSLTEKKNDAYALFAASLKKETGLVSLIHLIAPEQSWKRSLDELINVTNRKKEPEQSTRLAWMIDYQDGNITIIPKEQKKTGTGTWSRGRLIALSRLQQGNLDYLGDQDRRICSTLVQTGEEGAADQFSFDLNKALPALVGNPFLFLAKSPSSSVEFVTGEPELLVEERGDFLFIHFAQDINDDNVTLHRETSTRFKIIEINENHRRVARITGPDGLQVPKSSSKKVLRAIGNISSYMTVHSAIADDSAMQDTLIVDADPTVHLHLVPVGSGFRLEMFVRPFQSDGPYLKPGRGVANVIAEIDNRRLQTKRNLKLEEQKAREVEESCPILDLAIDMEHGNEREWHLQDPEECLQTLLELETIRDRVIIEWPEGEKLAIRRQAGINQLNLNIRTSQQDWFALSGQLRIDQDNVIDLKTLLDEVQKKHSRFIPMGNGQYLALTQEFRKQLDELILYSRDEEKRADDELMIHPLAAGALEELTGQAILNADEGWQKRIKTMREAENLKPEVPSTLQAELRDYQIEGFTWLARLAHLGLGGCLADDMGLGKTLQALALILRLAKDGPTLVIAPTSVCMNWEIEINRFTPTLNIHMLDSTDRQSTIDGLGKFDLLITSYTLLQQEIELLNTVAWQTAVLDEAQAIKNAATKRSRAAMQLQARFKLITTGTPIENHLGELWNLFRFANPGLLGSFKHFNSRFGIPIEKHNDREVRLKLKKLIQPYILRRIKSQVLEELPPRTEITLRVEMNDEERNFYEALRQQAIENIEENGIKKGRQIQILAEIMKLRRTCCNPKLVMPDTKITSSKLEVFAAVVEELLGSRHKALVFSQFTGHLALIREYLDSKSIDYKYLDGTTPAKERKRQVETFQSGDGDLFLISLKAGGLGLNLTAADYVIHMDPWWNPAVEDQAADRAHRIGQKRPVTVYRLVTSNTIEEKIVRLHREKRDLADSLLEGTDISARISAKELLELIKER